MSVPKQRRVLVLQRKVLVLQRKPKQRHLRLLRQVRIPPKERRNPQRKWSRPRAPKNTQRPEWPLTNPARPVRRYWN